MQNFSYIVFLAFVAFQAASAQECPPEGVVFIPHTDCTKYFICDNGASYEMYCPPDLFFNPAIEQCDFPDNVPECVGGTRPPVGSSTPPPTTPSTEPTTPSTEPTTPSAEPTTTTPPTETTTPETGPTEPTTTQTPVPGVLTKCGDTSNENSGRIEYRLSENYEANELCSFVIRVPSHSGIVFKLNSNGINGTADPNAINIFTFSELGQIDAVHLGPPNPLDEVYVSGALAVVIFKSDGNQGSGFQLDYEGVGNTAYSQGVELTFSDLEGGELVVPSWANYSGTTNAIVLSAGNKAFTDLSTLKMTISDEDFYTCGGGASCGCDSIRVFSFRSDHTVEEGVFCDELQHRTVYETDGLLIVIFRKFWDGGWGTAKLTWRVDSL